MKYFILLLLWLSDVARSLNGFRFYRIINLQNQRISKSHSVKHGNKAMCFLINNEISKINEDAEEVPKARRMTIEEELDVFFNRTMKREKVPLLSCIDKFKESLPVRRESEIVSKLYEHKYYGAPQSIQRLAKRVLKSVPKYRGEVMYFAAPTCTGKSASVLPIFLAGTKEENGFTHYFHLPFDNNNGNYFKLDPPDVDQNANIALNQGADFMSKCIKSLLEYPFSSKPCIRRIPRNDNPPDLAETTENLRGYLKEKLGPGCVCLIHADEHRNMCNREDEVGKQFSQGAFKLLTDCGMKVIATYINKPLIPPEKSSKICRIPLSLPELDVEQLLNDEEGLLYINLKNVKFTPEQERLWSTLKLRLRLNLRAWGIGAVLFSKYNLKEFIIPFQKAVKDQSMSGALKRCVNLCKFEAKSAKNDDPNAMKLLLSAEEKDDDWDRQVSDLIFLLNGQISCSLERLLSIYDKNYPIYNRGRMVFEKVLSSNPSTDDFLSGTPLEAAYCWALSSRSAFDTALNFPTKVFEIKCKKLVPSRLFPDDKNTSSYDAMKLQENTMYYVKDEKIKNEESTHPLADIFFLTKEKELVLVDIYGGGRVDGVNKKAGKLSKWIDQEQEKEKNVENGITLFGVVLAPSVDEEVVLNFKEVNENVLAVSGEKAKDLLGGLRQIFEE